MNAAGLRIPAKTAPPLDPGFVPAALWNRAFLAEVAASGTPEPAAVALEQNPESVSVFHTELLPAGHPHESLNARYMERLVKFLLYQKGGWKISLAAPADVIEQIRAAYGPNGTRAFDWDFIGRRVYGRPLRIEGIVPAQLPAATGSSIALGRHFDGCRIGFDLGGSDRKCAAVVDGRVVHSEEVAWDPYFQADPGYHLTGIEDSLRRAAAVLPRVDAIGGSAAGVYVGNEVRLASLFRGVPDDVFNTRVRGMFLALRDKWGVPFEVLNDGEVTALAGSIATGQNAVLGIAMGTSQAAGYICPDGGMTTWLNELAFAPIDYRPDAPVDEWSGDAGCGVQYLSQQAVARLCTPAGIDLPADMPFAEKLVEVQSLAEADDPRAVRIYETIGVYLGYAIAHYAAFYEIENMLLLGRVLTGRGGEVIDRLARNVLDQEFPELARRISFRQPGEEEKRHGQAVAAASLPTI